MYMTSAMGLTFHSNSKWSLWRLGRYRQLTALTVTTEVMTMKKYTKATFPAQFSEKNT